MIKKERTGKDENNLEGRFVTGKQNSHKFKELEIHFRKKYGFLDIAQYYLSKYERKMVGRVVARADQLSQKFHRKAEIALLEESIGNGFGSRGGPNKPSNKFRSKPEAYTR